ncbi:MAG TPA: potassium channel family protein [Jiangellaceae bacterium]
MTMDIALAVAGLLLVGLALWDVWSTVLHPDAEGVLARGIRRTMWRLATGCGVRLPSWRRHLLSLAGPAIIALTFIAWISLVILGLTLIAYPMRDSYVAVGTTGELTLLDVLYYVGGTVTVLGYGDIVPVSGTGQLLALAASVTGFTMFTGMASYLIEVVTGMTTRNCRPQSPRITCRPTWPAGCPRQRPTTGTGSPSPGWGNSSPSEPVTMPVINGISDQYAAVVVHRSRILLDGLKQWTRGDIDNHEWEA